VAAAVHGGAGRGVLNGAVPGVPSGRFGAPVCAPALANRRGMLHPADTLLAERAAGAHAPGRAQHKRRFKCPFFLRFMALDEKKFAAAAC